MSDNCAQVLVLVAGLVFWGWTQWLGYRKGRPERCCRGACAVCSGHPVRTDADDQYRNAG